MQNEKKDGSIGDDLALIAYNAYELKLPDSVEIM